jgi:hypothetical protein
MEDQEIKKRLNQLTRQSSFFKKLNELKYHHLKGYGQYKDVMFQLARALVGYQFYSIEMFEADFTHKNSVLILDHALNQGFASYWLDENLFEAFTNTQLPTAILEFKRVVPVGLLFLPARIKNPDGQYIRWLLFSHHLANENRFSVKLPRCQLDLVRDEIEVLKWMSILDDGTQYAVSHKIILENQQLVQGANNMYINEKMRSLNLNIQEEKESDFTIKVTNLLMQTLLYLQAYPENLSQSSSSNVSRNARKGSNQKQMLSPNLIGKNYQVKRQSSSGNNTGHQKATHWRKGFYKYQPYGSRSAPKYKLIWIEPVLVNG